MERSVTASLGCRLVPSSAPVATSYRYREDCACIVRVHGDTIDCTVRSSDDVPITRSLADTRALIEAVDDVLRDKSFDGDSRFQALTNARLQMAGFYLQSLARTLAADSTGNLARGLSKELTSLVPNALAKPYVWTRYRQNAETLVAGAAAIVRATRVADYAAWPQLWAWSADGRSRPQTRFATLQALEAILDRGTVAVTAQTASFLEKIADELSVWETLWPTYSAEERSMRATVVAQANSTIATAVRKLADKGIDVEIAPISVPAAGPRVPWVPLLGAGAGAVGIVIVAVLARDHGRKPRKRPSPRRRSR